MKAKREKAQIQRKGKKEVIRNQASEMRRNYRNSKNDYSILWQ